jgi:hypothetical protein
MAKTKPDKQIASAKEATFTKQQLLESKTYVEKKDLLNALLVDGRSYSLAETEEILNGFLKGKVI